MLSRPDPFNIHDAAAGRYIDIRNKRILEDNRRQIAEAERSQREHEERERTEIEAAKERDRQAYRERGWAERITRWADVRCAPESGRIADIRWMSQSGPSRRTQWR